MRKSEKIISPNAISLRKVHPAEIRQIENSRLLYLDETGFNLHTSANYGYSPKNMEEVRMISANISL